jgi:hypothetical protein
MSFMHFEGATAAAGNDVISLSGSLASPNVASANSGTDDGNDYVVATAGFAFSAWTISGLVKGNVMRRSNNSYSSYQSATQWINNKDFTAIYFIRAQHDPASSGDPLWGDPPDSGNALDQWNSLIPNKTSRQWLWSCGSQLQCTASGTVFVEIARTGSSVTFDTDNVNAGSDYVTTNGNHGFSTGDVVVYDTDGGTAEIGLFDSIETGSTYYVRSLASDQLAF